MKRNDRHPCSRAYDHEVRGKTGPQWHCTMNVLYIGGVLQDLRFDEFSHSVYQNDMSHPNLPRLRVEWLRSLGYGPFAGDIVLQAVCHN
jgi:hypothetical protein